MHCNVQRERNYSKSLFVAIQIIFRLKINALVEDLNTHFLNNEHGTYYLHSSARVFDDAKWQVNNVSYL